jgi:nucleoside-diphosphate-sugar epimerase
VVTVGAHVVLGAGAIGRGTAVELAARGEEVILVSRSGRDVGMPGVVAQAADVTDRRRISELATGATSIVNALNPAQYWKWDELWPPMAAAVLAAAEASGAHLVTVGNLYVYGRVDAPMTETTPLRPNGHKGELRARMWLDALASHEAGRVRATEVRGSDYIGQGMDAQSFANDQVVKPALSGRRSWLWAGVPDAPHTWTNGADVAKLVARLCLEPADSDAWGRPWHVPSAEPRTIAELQADAAALVGQSRKRPRGIPRLVVDAIGLGHPLLRELKETRHQFERPFVLDSSSAQVRFGLEPSPWHVTLKETVDHLSVG